MPISEPLRGRRLPKARIATNDAAMIAGMIPMAIGFGEGGDQTAPLARAVVGGLLAATAATLVLLPAAFTWIMGNAGRGSVSLDPTDPESARFHTPPEVAP